MLSTNLPALLAQFSIYLVCDSEQKWLFHSKGRDIPNTHLMMQLRSVRTWVTMATSKSCIEARR